MKISLKRILAVALVLCSMMAYVVPAADAAAQKVTYDFNQLDYYTNVPEIGGKSNPLVNILQGYTLKNGTVKKPMTQRYLNGNQNWTYEAASTDLCGNTGADEHLPASNIARMLSAYGGLRIAMGKNQDSWFAFRFKSPGAGSYTMDLSFYSYAGAPTVAFYILEAEGEASADHDTVMARQERIHNEMDPGNRIGKVNQSAGVNGSKNNTAYIGQYTFEAGKEYILVAEVYALAAIPTSYACFSGVSFTKNGTVGTQLKGEPEVGSVRVLQNAVPASDGGTMGAVMEVNGHDYFFLPREGSRMSIYDLDKFAAGEEALVQTVSTGLYYPTHATVTDDGKVIVGGDGKRMYIFNTKTMTGSNTPDFRATPGLENGGHNQGSFYNADDGLIYFGTLYDGHMARYHMDTKTYDDLGDMVCKTIQEMALGKTLAKDKVDDSGGVRSTVCVGGYAYGLACSDRYSIVVKYDLTQNKVVAALNVTEAMGVATTLRYMSALGDKYLIIGGSGVSGMTLIELSSFALVSLDQVVSKGLFTSKTGRAEDAWTNGMIGHATEVVDGKQYFFISSTGMYSYEIATGKMAYVGNGTSSFRTGQRTKVTLDRNRDGVEETYLFTFAGGGQPRLFDPARGNKLTMSGKLEVDMSSAGGSTINIGTDYDDVLYIGAWNNWNCVAYDTGAEAVKSRYVTGGQTDSQVSYVDEEGSFHLISGNYSACVVYEIDPLNKTNYGGDGDSNIIKPLISNMRGYQQKRIHTVAAGDGYVFAGTIPESYVNGGGVGTYNYATGEETFLHFKETPTAGEPTVPAEFKELWDLAVKGIVYYDGRLYGATTRSGGSGSGAVEGTSAQIFVMDYENNRIEATLDLREYLTLVDADGDGAEDPIDYVGGISVDELGRFWGLCSDVLYCFTYDKTTKTFKVQEVLNLGHSEYKASGGVGQHNRKVVFDPENSQLYVAFYNFGMRQLTLKKWNASVGNLQLIGNTQLLSSAPETYAMGANGNLYYASGTDLYMKPVNVTASQWTKAQAVDKQITALGNITTEDAAAVKAAREAYEALSLRDKALVQELFTLQEAEAYLMNLQLGQIAQQVTGEDYETLHQIDQAYGEMTSRQQRYVKNYGLLEAAITTAAILHQDESLNQLQKDIFALEVSALEDTEYVTQLRRAVNALPEEQSSQMNLDRLTAAEETLAALWKTSGEDIASGTCGQSLTWTLSGRGVLTVSGLGVISEAPWSGHSAFIKEAELSGGIYEIADGAFYPCSSLTTVYYGGTQAQKEAVDIGQSNQALTDARWHYEAVSFMLGAQTVRQCGCCTGYHYENAAVNVFADVPNNGWQMPFAVYACQKGLMAGKGTDIYGRVKFDPNSPITREEFVQVLYNAEGKPAFENDRQFPDVKNAWYKNAVLWANSRNIANGMGNGNFGIGMNITRQDLALMLYKYAALKGVDLTAEAGYIDQFADGSKVSGYAATAMNWAVKNGILSGKGEADKPLSTFRLDPAGTATRAECAAMLKNFMSAFSLGEDLPVCAHGALQASAGKEVTCTEDGDLAYWYCADCDRYYSDAQGSVLLAPASIHLRAEGHSWQDATCTTPRTCSVCRLTEGTENGHSWLDATCTEPKTCSVCQLTEGEPVDHLMVHLETVPPTCSAEGYDLYECDYCDYQEKCNFYTPASHSYVTMDLPSAAMKAFDSGILGYAPYATSSYADYDTKICTGCNKIDIAATRFRYTQREAAQIMLGYVNDLRAEVYGTHAYDMVLDEWCQSVAEKRAVQLTTNYSHSGKQTPGENIASGLSIYEQFVAWKNSPNHYDTMINRQYTRFGYGYASCGDNGFNAAHGYGCQTFNWG